LLSIGPASIARIGIYILQTTVYYMRARCYAPASEWTGPSGQIAFETGRPRRSEA